MLQQRLLRYVTLLDTDSLKSPLKNFTAGKNDSKIKFVPNLFKVNTRGNAMIFNF